MNWSNGQLARHSRKSYNNDATKQKQYFAEAKRQKATESQKQKHNASDFVPSYLQDPPGKSSRSPQEARRHRESRHKILSLQGVSNIGGQSTSTGGADRAKDFEITGKPKRLHGVSERGDADIDAKRRKLLQQNDWSGVELQKPVVIEYPETAKSAKSAKRCQRHITRDKLTSPIVNTTTKNRSADMVIKIASQEYRWSPGNNSIRTYRSKEQHSRSDTPITERGALYETSSSASKSFSSFVPESPCAERALQIERGRMNTTQLQSVSHTSPSIFDEPLVKTVTVPQYFHPQPIRHMHRSVYTRLSDSAHNGEPVILFEPSTPSTPSKLQSDTSSYIPATESGIGENEAAEDIKTNKQIRLLESPRINGSPALFGLQPPLHRNSILGSPEAPSVRSVEAVHDQEPPIAAEALPNVYSLTSTSHPDNRLSALPYKPPAPPQDLACEDENILWKQFVLGASQVGAIGLGEKHCSDSIGSAEPDSRSKLGIQTSAMEAPTRIASKFKNASPVPDTRRRPGPTPAPTGRTLPLTISAEGPYSASTAHKPQTTSDDEVPVYFRKPSKSLEVIAPFSTEAKDISQFTLPKMGNLSTRPDLTFHPPSLFVGRLVASSASAPVVVAQDVSEPAKSISVPKTTSAPVMSRRRRNKRREAGRPDIRAVPNIQDDPIEFTP